MLTARPMIISMVLLWTLLASFQQPAVGGMAVVKAVLFYSPTCRHCHDVIEQVLKPLAARYGNQLEISVVNVREPAGQMLYQNTIERFSIPDDRRGVPTLVVGDQVLVGAAEIPEKFPTLVERWLAEGGISLPDIPGLADLRKETPVAAPSYGPQDLTASPLQMLARDPVGNGLALVVLAVMVGVLLYNLARFTTDMKNHASPRTPGLPVAAVALVGLGIATYMGYVETAEVMAVCGPVGDCNTVQQSEYASLFGIPLGVLGIGGYLIILAVWLLARFAAPRPAALGTLALFSLALGGTLFSIYLTFLEPFVIGATCAWCLGSALCMTLLLALARRPAAAAFGKMRGFA